MNFLKILFWIVLTAVVVVFSINNWTPATLNLWGGLQADIKMPILMLLFGLIGWLPTFIYYRAQNWRLNRRLDTVERELSDARGIKQFRSPERVEPTELSPESGPVPNVEPIPTAPKAPPPGASE